VRDAGGQDGNSVLYIIEGYAQIKKLFDAHCERLQSDQ
jgi:hypothetical protein